jgi:hypothetical protein
VQMPPFGAGFAPVRPPIYRFTMLCGFAPRWLAVAATLFLVAGGVLAFGQVSGTFAIFTADAENPGNLAAGGWVPPPTGLSDVVTGGNNNKVELDWTSGSQASQPNPNPVTGQELDIADGGSGASASCGAYTEVSTYGANKSTVNDGGTGVPTADWWCYQMVSTTDGTWTSSAAFPPFQLLVPLSVTFSGDGDGILESGETITITFNQPVASSSLSIGSGICQVKGNSGSVILGYSGTCNGSASYAIGKITSIKVTGATGGTAATVNVAGDVVTITATAAGQTIASGDGTFVAADSVTNSSNATAACIAAECKVAPSGSF